MLYIIRRRGLRNVRGNEMEMEEVEQARLGAIGGRSGGSTAER